jgi:S-adenosylmethionine-dependent methyltransferase
MDFFQAEIASIPDLFSQARFDLVLCHNVLQYVGDLQAALAAICHAALPGGLLSIICGNRYSESYREALQQLRPGAALEKLDTRTIFSGVFKTDMRAYTADEMSEALRQSGCEVIAQYGVRCVYDYVPDDELKNSPAFFAELERLEQEMSARFPYYLMARFFQIIGRKEGCGLVEHKLAGAG